MFSTVYLMVLLLLTSNSACELLRYIASSSMTRPPGTKYVLHTPYQKRRPSRISHAVERAPLLHQHGPTFGPNLVTIHFPTTAATQQHRQAMLLDTTRQA